MSSRAVSVTVSPKADVENPPWMNAETRSLADRLLLETTLDSDPSLFWKQRSALAKAITLLESRGHDKEEQASALMTYLLKKSPVHGSFRVGFAGSPGAGKSTFIEALGKYVLDLPKVDAGSVESTVWTPLNVAIVCIDPSSIRTGGSILGDKTRMTALSANPRVFIRPSAAQGALGGLAPRTDDVLRLLAHQYPLTFLETVGLGQSEVEVQQSVDMLVLAIPPGGGDDLQGVKKGIVEVADLIVVTKADGNLLATARHTAADYRGAMQFLSSVTSHGDENRDRSPTQVLLTSAVDGTGLESVWNHICEFRRNQTESRRLERRRQEQGRYWMWKHLQAAVHAYTESDPSIQDLARKLNKDLDEATIPPRVAANILFEKIKQR
jgi:LAO/AO transport system kinase